ncbi:hypothetical protein SDC9_115778 [bioreactor metagenome]|uniref:Uncharacterized protein n=1 Tax=bioreactor metagenome TaxID=1076179 RepID=A0A645C0I8_9ZZZZ
MNVPEGVAVVFGQPGSPDIIRIGGQRVGRHRQDHAADLRLRGDLTGDLRSRRRGHQLVVNRLIQLSLGQLLLGSPDTTGHQGRMQHRVDLIERQPVLHPSAIALEDGARKALVAADQLAIRPTVVGLGQMQRSLVVGDGDQRLHAVLLALVEHPVVERQTGLVGLGLVPLREDAAPGDREAEDREAHLGEQRDVVAIAMVEVDALEFEVVGGRFIGGRGHDAVRHHVLDGRALAVDVPGALQLVGGGRAAPQESFGERLGGERGRGHLGSFLRFPVSRAMCRMRYVASSSVSVVPSLSSSTARTFCAAWAASGNESRTLVLNACGCSDSCCPLAARAKK